MFQKGPDFTCNVLMGHKTVKASVDTRAPVSLINSRVFRQLRFIEKFNQWIYSLAKQIVVR